MNWPFQMRVDVQLVGPVFPFKALQSFAFGRTGRRVIAGETVWCSFQDGIWQIGSTPVVNLVRSGMVRPPFPLSLVWKQIDQEEVLDWTPQKTVPLSSVKDRLYRKVEESTPDEVRDFNAELFMIGEEWVHTGLQAE
jgi:hypothetical protein